MRQCSGRHSELTASPAGCFDAEERSLDMEGVRGSIPLPPTSKINALSLIGFQRAHVSPMKSLKIGPHVASCSVATVPSV